MAAPAALRSRRSSFVVPVALVTWAAVLFASVQLGRWLRDRGTHIVLPTPPVLGRPIGASVLGLTASGLVGLALIVVLPTLASRLSWRRLLFLVAAGSLVWWIGLALAEGPSGLVRGPSSHTEYLHDVPAVRAAPGEFLRTFTDDIDRYEIHVRGHPPGMVLLLAGLDAQGLRGARWEAALVLTAAATAPLAALLAVRDLAGEPSARRAAPFLVLAPAAIWIATSADALYMALAAWSVTALVLATRHRGRRSAMLAIFSGLFGAAALLGSYGMVLVALIPALAAWRRRRFLAPVIAGATVALALAALLPLGYSWLVGLSATRHEYAILDLDRPYAAFLLLNLGAWALALGPATIVGVAVLRDRWLWCLVGGGLAAALLANVSGLSEGEVERIWLPFGLWVLPAGAALASAGLRTRPWLAAQVATALVLVGTVRTQW